MDYADNFGFSNNKDNQKEPLKMNQNIAYIFNLLFDYYRPNSNKNKDEILTFKYLLLDYLDGAKTYCDDDIVKTHLQLEGNDTYRYSFIIYNLLCKWADLFKAINSQEFGERLNYIKEASEEFFIILFPHESSLEECVQKQLRKTENNIRLVINYFEDRGYLRSISLLNGNLSLEKSLKFYSLGAYEPSDEHNSNASGDNSSSTTSDISPYSSRQSQDSAQKLNLSQGICAQEVTPESGQEKTKSGQSENTEQESYTKVHEAGKASSSSEVTSSSRVNNEESDFEDYLSTKFNRRPETSETSSSLSSNNAGMFREYARLIRQIERNRELEEEERQKMKAIMASLDSDSDGDTSTHSRTGKSAKPLRVNLERYNAFNQRDNSNYEHQFSDIQYIGNNLLKDRPEIKFIVTGNTVDCPGYTQAILESAKEHLLTDEIENKIIGIHNLGNFHWCAFVFFKSNNEEVMCLYKDSKGNAPDQNFINSADKVFTEGELKKIVCFPEVNQREHVNCGIFSLKNAAEIFTKPSAKLLEYYKEITSPEFYSPKGDYKQEISYLREEFGRIYAREAIDELKTACKVEKKQLEELLCFKDTDSLEYLKNKVLNEEELEELRPTEDTKKVRFGGEEVRELPPIPEESEGSEGEKSQIKSQGDESKDSLTDEIIELARQSDFNISNTQRLQHKFEALGVDRSKIREADSGDEEDKDPSSVNKHSEKVSSAEDNANSEENVNTRENTKESNSQANSDTENNDYKVPAEISRGHFAHTISPAPYLDVQYSAPFNEVMGTAAGANISSVEIDELNSGTNLEEVE